MTDRERAQGIFIEALRLSPNVSAAARAAGVSRAVVYHWRAESKEFRGAWQAVLDEGLDTLEARVMARANDDDYPGAMTAAIFMLKSHRPRVYSERFRHMGENMDPVRVTGIVVVPRRCESDEEWSRLYGKPKPEPMRQGS